MYTHLMTATGVPVSQEYLLYKLKFFLGIRIVVLGVSKGCGYVEQEEGINARFSGHI